jgi:hypothetical protein
MQGSGDFTFVLDCERRLMRDSSENSERPNLPEFLIASVNSAQRDLRAPNSSEASYATPA